MAPQPACGRAVEAGAGLGLLVSGVAGLAGAAGSDPVPMLALGFVLVGVGWLARLVK